MRQWLGALCGENLIRKYAILHAALWAALLAPALMPQPALAADAVYAVRHNPPAELTDTIAGVINKSITYYIGRYEDTSGLLPVLKANEKHLSSKLSERPEPASTAELLHRIHTELTNLPGITPAQATALERAVSATESYYYISGKGIYEPTALPEANPAARANLSRITDFDPAAGQKLPMHDVNAYIAGQLGPAAVLIDRISTGPFTVIFSPAPPEKALALLPQDTAELYQLDIPGSIYAFSAYLAFTKTGPVMLLCNFAGESWYTHMRYVYSLYFSQRGLKPDMLLDSSGANAFRACAGLEQAFGPEYKLPRRFRGLILGYFQEIRSVFSVYLKQEVSTPSFTAAEFEINGNTYIALETRDSWYGDILGRTLTGLLNSGVQFDEVYFAGSAGSLKYHTPYTLAHADCFYDSNGNILSVANILNGSGSGGTACHVTVPSPLAENSGFLAALPQNTDTIDVEGLHLVKSLTTRKTEATIKLGISYLITDYPKAIPATEKFALSAQRYPLKLAGTRAYAQTLLKHLTKGTLSYSHPIENALQKDIKGISSGNISRLKASLGQLTPAEAAAASALAQTTPPVIFRLNANRLKRVLESGIALAPREVGILNGQGVSTNTFTPSAEDTLYGAWEYLFAGAGQNTRKGMYGDISLYVSTQAWQTRSYATRYAGFKFLSRADADAGELAAARSAWADDIFAPEDYAAALGLSFVQYTRTLSPDNAKRSLDSIVKAKSHKEIYTLIKECDTCYLEAKLHKYLLPQEIACAELPPARTAEFENMPGAELIKGKVRSTPDACLAP